MLHRFAVPRYSVVFGIFTLLIGFAFGWVSAVLFGDSGPVTGIASMLGVSKLANAPSQQVRNDFGLFWEVWNLVETEFYQQNPIDQQRMIQGAIKGMLASLDDPYTLYQEPELAAQTNDHMRGTLEGIGAYIRINEGKAYIDRPIKDSPAMKAGLKQDDEIVKIDGEPVDQLIANLSAGDATTRISAKIRGAKGTTVALTLRRAPNPQTFDTVITRDEVLISSVNSQMLDDGVAYIQITDFKSTTTHDFDEAMRTLLPKRPKGLILDLRNNPGGYLTNAQEVLGRLYDGVALHEEDRDGKLKTLPTISGPAEAQAFDLPLVVLVNNNSASASEIVAGALRDERTATYLIGEKTFGKGSVQNIHTLSNGGSARITFAHWLTPNKNEINKIGITPQYVLPYAEDATSPVPCVADRRPPAGKTTCADNQLASSMRLLETGQVPTTPAASVTR